MDVSTDRDLFDFTDLEAWPQRILDTESRGATSEDFRETIDESLRRQHLDGFLTAHDIIELQYIADLWGNLLNATSCYTVGCVFVKRDKITYLLELYSLRQITSILFIETCLKLRRIGKFYLDLGFPNGNYYLADILEIALVAGESRNIFQSYVKIHYSVPQRVQQLNGVTNSTIKSLGHPFREIVNGLVEFLPHEQVRGETLPIIIAHGG